MFPGLTDSVEAYLKLYIKHSSVFTVINCYGSCDGFMNTEDVKYVFRDVVADISEVCTIP